MDEAERAAINREGQAMRDRLERPGATLARWLAEDRDQAQKAGEVVRKIPAETIPTEKPKA